MKKTLTRLGNNKLLIVFVVVLQIVIVILILNPFSLIIQNQQNNIIGEATTLANDPDFRNARLVQITNADSFKKDYLLNEDYNEIKDNDYVLVVNNKFIVYRSDEKKIIFQGDTPSSLLDITRLTNLISSKAFETKVIKESEQPALKIYNAEIDKNNFEDYFLDLKNGDVLAFFPLNKIIVLYNLQTNEVKSSKTFNLDLE